MFELAMLMLSAGLFGAAMPVDFTDLSDDVDAGSENDDGTALPDPETIGNNLLDTHSPSAGDAAHDDDHDAFFEAGHEIVSSLTGIDALHGAFEPDAVEHISLDHAGHGHEADHPHYGVDIADIVADVMHDFDPSTDSILLHYHDDEPVVTLGTDGNDATVMMNGRHVLTVVGAAEALTGDDIVLQPAPTSA